jgi:hypothetical protein
VLNAFLMLVSSSMCKEVLVLKPVGRIRKSMLSVFDTLEKLLGVAICRRKYIGLSE